MSRAYLFLGFTSVATVATISYVHWDQKKELRRMREGVYRDAERERSRRAALRQNASLDHLAAAEERTISISEAKKQKL